jgi:hypothetical protein
MWGDSMSDEEHSQVLGALPRTRPHRRSDKRAARPAEADQSTAAANGEAQSPPRAPNGEAQSPPPAPNGEAQSPPPAPASEPASTTPSAPRRKRAAASAARGKHVGAGARKTASPRVRKSPTAASGRLRQPAQPEGTPEARRPTRPAPPSAPDILGTAVQAAAELAEIGLSVSARAIRRAVSRLPRP